MAYLPYGQERGTPTTPDNREKFGTYWRDQTLGADYADQRYYAFQPTGNWPAGRFLSPDPGGMRTVDSSNPQTWNRYSYAHGDSVNAVDPHGTLVWDPPTAQDCIANPLNPQCGDPCMPLSESLLDAPLPGCYAGAPAGPPQPAPPRDPDQCMAVLWSRPVEVTGVRHFATHAYWEVEEYDPNSGTMVTDKIISAGPGDKAVPNPPSGKATHDLDVWVHSPNDPNSGDTPGNATWEWDTGWSADNCAGVNAMLRYANSWPNDNSTSGIPYSWRGPNSNSAAALLGQYGGFDPPRPPGAIGWSYWLN